MEEVNFLSNQSKGKGRKDDKKKSGKKIEWSEPAIADGVKSEPEGSMLSGWFSFFKKDKNSKQDKKNAGGSNSLRKNAVNLIKEQPIIKKEKKNNLNKPAKAKKTKQSAKKQAKPREENQEWENPDILETNLIKDEIVSFFDWRKGATNLLITCLFPCFIIGAIYGFLFFWGQQINLKNQDIINKINKTNQQIEELEAEVKDILFFNKKLNIAGQILDNHIYWTNFFEFLENYTLSDVFYDSFSGGINGDYILTAHAKDFWTIAQQIKIMRADNNVIMVSASSGQSSAEDGEEGSGVGFKLELSVKPDIFTPLEKNP